MKTTTREDRILAGMDNLRAIIRERDRQIRTAAERERALREENERLTDDNAYLNDLITSYEIGTVQKAWSDHAERQDAQIVRLRGKCNRLRDAYLKATDTGGALAKAMRAGSWRRLDEDNGLHHGDLTPEPHGATQEDA